MKLITLNTALTAAALALTFASSQAFAARAPRCQAIFEIPSKTLTGLQRANYDADNAKAAKSLAKLKRAWPGIAEKEALLSSIKEVILDESLSAFHQTLTRVLDATTESLENRRRANGGQLEVFKANLVKEVSRLMPESDAATRANLISRATLDKATMMKALGHMTAEESLIALVGPNGIRDVGTDSLVGRYLARARAAGVRVTTHIGRFKTGPESNTLGNERLYISVDENTMQIANEIFGTNSHFLIHEHDVNQGTLHMHHAGQDFNYASFDGEVKPLGYRQHSWRNNVPEIQVGTIAPLIVLSTTEASNVINYGELGRLTNNSRSKYPWGLKKTVRQEETSYCRESGYQSCTHWIGEMPIGDKIVNSLSFPGNVGDDSYTNSQTSSRDGSERGLRTKAVGTYTHFVSHSSSKKIGFASREDRLTRLVWGQGASHQQLWDMVGGLSHPLQEGEFANPGWVLYSFLGPASADRVPVVLYYRENASAAFNRETLAEMQRKISPH